jgi:hypothetical protein
MVKHVLFWKLKDQAEGRSKAENMPVLRDLVLALPAAIPQIRNLEFGTNFASVPAAFDVAVTLVFDSRSDFETFLQHPAHLALGQKVNDMRDSWAVVDYETAAADSAASG